MKFTLALIIGGAIGLNRQLERKPAGLRTHMLVCLSATIFMSIPLELSNANQDRDLLLRGFQAAIQGVATGIGFLGAGEILHKSYQGQEKVAGLTSAAAIWLSSALGLAIGAGLYYLAIIATIYSLFVLQIVKKWED